VNSRIERAARIGAALLGSLALWACAVPATEVAVQTMPMQQAFELARIEAGTAYRPQAETARLAPTAAPPGIQEPMLGVPEVRLAYLYEWIDGDGNKHFGEWVAIPIAGFEWIMNDGTRAPLDSGAREKPQQPADQ